MKTLLRNVPTGLYVQSPDRWTSRLEEACDFKTLSQAIRFVESAGLRKMELTFVSPNLCRCTAVPLDILRWGRSISGPVNTTA